MNIYYKNRYTTEKPHIYKVCGRWVWMQNGSCEVVKEKNEVQLFVDSLNKSKF
jgi:hypothetical protein